MTTRFSTIAFSCGLAYKVMSSRKSASSTVSVCGGCMLGAKGTRYNQGTQACIACHAHAVRLHVDCCRSPTGHHCNLPDGSNMPINHKQHLAFHLKRLHETRDRGWRAASGMHRSCNCGGMSAHVSDLHSELVDAPPQVFFCLLIPLVGYAVVQLVLDFILTLESVILLCPLSFQTLMTQPYSACMPGSLSFCNFKRHARCVWSSKQVCYLMNNAKLQVC